MTLCMQNVKFSVKTSTASLENRLNLQRTELEDFEKINLIDDDADSEELSPEMEALANEWIDRIIKEQRLEEKWKEMMAEQNEKLEQLTSIKLAII